MEQFLYQQFFKRIRGILMKLHVVYDKNGKLIAAALDTPAVSNVASDQSKPPSFKFIPKKDQHLGEFEAPEVITKLKPEEFLKLPDLIKIDTKPSHINYHC